MPSHHTTLLHGMTYPVDLGSNWATGYESNLSLLDPNRISSDIIANRPAAAKNRRFFFSSDEYRLYFDNGTSWVELFSPQSGTASDVMFNSIVIKGTLDYGRGIVLYGWSPGSTIVQGAGTAANGWGQYVESSTQSLRVIRYTTSDLTTFDEIFRYNINGDIRILGDLQDISGTSRFILSSSTTNNTSTTTVAGSLRINHASSSIKDNSGTTRLFLGATNIITGILRVSSDLQVNGNVLDSGSSIRIIFSSSATVTTSITTIVGNLRVNGTSGLRVDGNVIRDSSNATRITLGATNIITGNLQITSNIIMDNTGATHITLSNNTTTSSVTTSFAGSLRINGATGIRDNANTTRITLGATNIITGILQVTGTLQALSDVTVATKLYINESSAVNTTIGLVINQGTNDDNIIELKSSDVAHGMTDIGETDTYLDMKKLSASNGGALLRGYSEAEQGFTIQGFVTTSSTVKTASAFGAVHISGGVKTGTNVFGFVANENILTIGAGQIGGSLVRFIFDEDGDMFYDGVAPANYDDHEDALAVQDAAYVFAGKKYFSKIVKHNAQKLHDMGVITYTPENKGHEIFISTKGLNGLMLGAIGEVYGVASLLCEKLGVSYTELRNEYRSSQPALLEDI